MYPVLQAVFERIGMKKKMAFGMYVTLRLFHVKLCNIPTTLSLFC